MINKLFVKVIPVLIKYKIALAVSFTSTAGYLLYTRYFDFYIIALILGVFSLAGGASALNEFQEKEYDAKMKRTMNRPLPSGEISPKTALLIAVIFILSGFVILYVFFGKVPALLGLSNVFWYNLLYTNLKRITAFAVVPGSLTGAVPALIGWTAAGGNMFDMKIIFIAFFLFIWQIPHFWLLMLKYDKEYEAAGFPTINQTVNPQNLKTIIFSWIISTSVFSLMAPLFITNISIAFFIAIFCLNILFVAMFTKLSFGKVAELNLKQSFISINVYMFIFLIMITLYQVFGG